jgi:hypothetical protein
MFMNNVLEVNAKFATQSQWPRHTDLRKKFEFQHKKLNFLMVVQSAAEGRGYDNLPADML